KKPSKAEKRQIAASNLHGNKKLTGGRKQAPGAKGTAEHSSATLSFVFENGMTARVRSTGPGLHFDQHSKGKDHDPVDFLLNDSSQKIQGPLFCSSCPETSSPSAIQASTTGKAFSTLPADDPERLAWEKGVLEFFHHELAKGCE
ncbi:unnamed protein product, partial [Amoebophrya sp. A25]